MPDNMLSPVGRKSQLSVPVFVPMHRLSRELLKAFNVDLDDSALSKLGYRAEKRPNNPNTYYRVPGASAMIENCPKTVAYIKREAAKDKATMQLLLGTTKVTLPPEKRSAAAGGGGTGGAAASGGAAPAKRRSAAAAAAAAAGQTADEEEEEESDSASSEEDGGEDDVAEGDDVPSKRQQLPRGYVILPRSKTVKVLEGLASYIANTTYLKSLTGAGLKAKGCLAIEESRPLAAGERMRHAYVWWPGRMTEPLRCAQYIFAAKNFMEMEGVREGLGLPPLGKAAAAAGGGSTSSAKKRPVADVTGPAAGSAAAAAAAAVKRNRSSTSDVPPKTPAAAAAVANQAAAAQAQGGVGFSSRSGRHTKASQAAAAAGADVGVNGARASHFPMSPSQAGPAAGGGAAPAAKPGLVRARGDGDRESAAAAAALRSSAAAAFACAASIGNQEALASVEQGIQQLSEALALARTLPPAVLNSLPPVFTAGLGETLQQFLSTAAELHEGLCTDRELLLSMSKEYDTAGAAAATGHRSSRGAAAAAAAAAAVEYRRPYIAFRAALMKCADDAAAWLADKQQQDMLARLQGLCQIKEQLDEQQKAVAAKEALALQREQEARRRELEVQQQLARKEAELKAAMEQLQMEKAQLQREKEEAERRRQEAEAARQAAAARATEVAAVAAGAGGDGGADAGDDADVHADGDTAAAGDELAADKAAAVEPAAADVEGAAAGEATDAAAGSDDAPV